MQQYHLVSRGRSLCFSTQKPLVMGILNLTPDSFYENSRVNTADLLLLQADKMLAEGAAILDLGAVSTRPNAAEVSEKEELSRLLPALRLLRQRFPDVWLSVDTFRAEVARAAAAAGADIINDISGGSEAEIWQVAADFKLIYVLTHIKGENGKMSQTPHYKELITEVADFFIEKLAAAHATGLHEIILDLGFGFGKTVAHNYELLAKMADFLPFSLPILAGISRKSMIYRPLNISADASLAATTALHLQALQGGASILRVHDVAEARQAVALANCLASCLASCLAATI
jgi:dihydropteroate synthase